MKKLLLLLFALALLLSSCTDIATEITETQDELQTSALSASIQTTSALTTDVQTTEQQPSDTEFSIPDEGTSLSARYEGDGYIACEFSDEARENIYFVVHLDNGQSIRCDRDENVSLIPSVFSMVYFVDINYDGIDDLCISMGNFGAQGVQIYKGYINTDGKYELCEGFEKIPNPVLDSESKIILGSNRENAAQRTYFKYEIDGLKVSKLETITYNIADGTVEKDDVTYPVSDFAEWDFDNEKWGNIIGIAPSSDDYIIKDIPYFAYFGTDTEKWKESLAKLQFALIDTYEADKYTASEYENAENELCRFSVTIKSEYLLTFDYYTAKYAGIPKCNSLAVITDINFDGSEDVCISIGDNGSAGDAMFYIAYLANGDGTYTFCDGFEHVANPVIDAENKCILSLTAEGASTTFYYRYVYEGYKVVQTDRIERYEPDESLYHNGELHSISEGAEDHDIYLSKNGEWNLDGDKWHNTLANANKREHVGSEN